jgi:hypothetical protein
MGSLKGSGLLLVLALPLVGYCALQVKDVLRTDIIASDPPADRGSPKEQLTAARTKAAASLTEVRKAATMVCQYRVAGAEDASTDPATTSVVKTSASRSADLDDLDKFLSEVEKPAFTGKLKDQYTKWVDERKELKRDEQAVLEWLGRPQTITSAEEATKAMDTVNGLIVQYATRSRFSDTSKASVWRVKARLMLADALAMLADTQYREAVKVKLPLKDGHNAVKTATHTLRGLKSMITLLNTDADAAEKEKPLEANLRAAVEAKSLIIDDCTAREELLELFGKPDLFTNAAGASAWLREVGVQYRKTKDEKTRQLIREKVQEFSNAFIPEVARLDDTVLLRGKAVDRAKVTIRFNKMGGAVMREKLSGDLDGVNEFNLLEKHSGESVFVTYENVDDTPQFLQPTDLSKTAVLFNAARKKLSDSTTVPKWTAKSVEELKKKCEAQKESVDKLQTLNNASVGKEPKIWTRLNELATGIAGNADLFSGQ